MAMSQALNERPKAYSAAARWLHLITAVIVLSLIPAGLAMTRMAEGETQDRLFSMHEEFGFLVLILAVARIWVRATRGAPAPAASLTPFERVASNAVHHALYAMIVIMPLLGWFGKSAYGAPISMFGWFDIPSIWPKDAKLSETIFLAHSIGGYVICGLLALHIGGALMHAFVKRDEVIGRMAP